MGNKFVHTNSGTANVKKIKINGINGINKTPRLITDSGLLILA
jgi:hypothetical protein